MPKLSEYVPTILKDAARAVISDETKECEKNITIIGTRGAAKTTMLGLMGLTCEIESVDNKNFTYDIQEWTVGIRQIISDLCQGKFPPATPPGHLFQAIMTMTWNSGWKGKTTVNLPLVETAGEDLENLIGAYRSHQYKQTPTYQQAEKLNKQIARSHAFILVVPVSRIQGLYPQIVDSEPESLIQNPDVNIVRMLDGIYKYRQTARSKPIEGIAVLLTKYDMVDQWLIGEGMNLETPEGQHKFLNTYLRQTMGKLKRYGYDKVKFFPMYVRVAKEILPDGKIRFKKRADDEGLEILTEPQLNLPEYSRTTCHQLIDWTRSIAG